MVQVALAVVLLFGASLFAHSLRKLKTINLGYDIHHLLTVDIERAPRLTRRGLPLPHLAFADILARVRRLPAVESAALSNPEILSDMKMSGDLTSNETSRKASEVIVMIVSPGYFTNHAHAPFRWARFRKA